MQPINQRDFTSLPNASFQQTIDRPHTHVVSQQGGITDQTAVNFYVPCSYPVREIIIRTNHCITCDTGSAFWIESNCPAFADSSVVAGLNSSVSFNSLGAAAQPYIIAGGFENSCFRYTLRQPMLLQGNWHWVLHSSLLAANYDAEILIDFEFIG